MQNNDHQREADCVKFFNVAIIGSVVTTLALIVLGATLKSNAHKLEPLFDDSTRFGAMDAAMIGYHQANLLPPPTTVTACDAQCQEAMFFNPKKHHPRDSRQSKHRHKQNHHHHHPHR